MVVDACGHRREAGGGDHGADAWSIVERQDSVGDASVEAAASTSCCCSAVIKLCRSRAKGESALRVVVDVDGGVYAKYAIDENLQPSSISRARLAS